MNNHDHTWIYVVASEDPLEVYGTYTNRDSAFAAAHNYHYQNDCVGNKTSILTTNMIEDASPLEERMEILQEEVAKSIPEGDLSQINNELNGDEL